MHSLLIVKFLILLIEVQITCESVYTLSLELAIKHCILAMYRKALPIDIDTRYTTN